MWTFVVNIFDTEFAGVEFCPECVCGKVSPSEANKVSDNECNMKCPKNSTEMCGGDLRIHDYISVWHASFILYLIFFYFSIYINFYSFFFNFLDYLITGNAALIVAVLLKICFGHNLNYPVISFLIGRILSYFKIGVVRLPKIIVYLS